MEAVDDNPNANEVIEAKTNEADEANKADVAKNEADEADKAN